jgi:hypothetical protein
MSCPIDLTCHDDNTCNEVTDRCAPTMHSYDITWAVAGVGSGSGSPLTCGDGDVVYSNPTACDAERGYDYRCTLSPDGMLSANVVGTGGSSGGGISLPCLGPFGTAVSSGCSSVIVYPPSLGYGHEFKCCFN